MILKRRGTDLARTLDTHGYTILRDAVDPALIDHLRNTCDAVPRAGIRNLFDAVPIARDIIDAKPIRSALRRTLGKAFVTRAILFDKTGESNWALPYHQDTAIAVDKHANAPGYGPWSVKQGVTHVRPPVQVLESMLTIRVHLDDADESNGALLVLPGSHTHGYLEDAQIAALQADTPPVCCDVKAGDAVLMRPLLLHASTRSTQPDRRRRVVHLEFSATPLPGGVQWARP